MIESPTPKGSQSLFKRLFAIIIVGIGAFVGFSTGAIRSIAGNSQQRITDENNDIRNAIGLLSAEKAYADSPHDGCAGSETPCANGCNCQGDE